MANLSFKSNFDGRDDLKVYGSSALLLYAFEIYFEIDDIKSFASDFLSDGPGDRKTDVIYVDTEKEIAVIAQGYFSNKNEKKEAPSSKAADLNTAASWVLSSDAKDLPESTIKGLINEVKEGITSGRIKTIEFWYVHNCYESENVKKELTQVGKTAYGLIEKYFQTKDVQIRQVEIGLNTLEEWYSNSKATILINDTFSVPITGGFETSGEGWESYQTSVSLEWLHQIYNNKQYRKNLFSANVRGYLGSRKSDSNINHGIKTTVIEDPELFWAYNNGITALVNNFTLNNSKKELQIQGISIVNGAQTTGAIGSIESIPNKGTVSIRFIKATSPKIIQNIIKFNNTQNKISASDFRSTDAYQDKLRLEFEKYPQPIVYTGGRRGGSDDKIKRPTNFLPFERVAQAIAAFHGSPELAYNRKGEIIDNDAFYSKCFNTTTSAKHIIFCYSLYAYIVNVKTELMAKSRGELPLDESDETRLTFLRNRGASYLLLAAIAASLEIIMGKPQTNKFYFRFKLDYSVDDAIQTWSPIVDSLLPIGNSNLQESLKDVLSNPEKITKDIEKFKSAIDAIKSIMNPIFKTFSEKVDLNAP